MLKIKDNVDLKELEKFGFKPEYDINTGELNQMYYEIKVDIFVYRIMIIPHKKEIQDTYYKPFSFFKRNKPKEIVFPKSYYELEIKDFSAFLSRKTTDILYELIKADFVEKVEE